MSRPRANVAALVRAWSPRAPVRAWSGEPISFNDPPSDEGGYFVSRRFEAAPSLSRRSLVRRRIRAWSSRARLRSLHGLTAAATLIFLLLATPSPAAPPPSKEFSVEKPATDNSPEAEARAFQLRPGFEVNLFASEKLGVSNPLSIRWDPRGRLWVLCTWAYPQLKPGEQPDDKLLILEDTDGDGAADKSTVFADGLDMPMGFEIGGGGAYVGAGTELLHLVDTDGDDRADERRVLLRGFGTGDTHQNINSFTWGPAGELMFGQGLHAYSRVETPWGIERLDKAGVWRLWPRRLKLDPFLNDAMGPTNPWGTVFDDWGQPFIVSGAGRGIYYLTPATIRTDHVEKIQPIVLKNKLCGVDILSGRHLPEELHGLMAVGHFWTNQVDLFALSENGAGFAARELEPLIQCAHKSFRPVDVKVGPDGAIYVADWFNPIVGHYQASFRHPDRDKTHGRIWRITAKNRPLVKPPDLVDASTAELLEKFRAPERWVRHQAKRVLADRPAQAVKQALETWVRDLKEKLEPQEYEPLLVEALGIYQSHELNCAPLAEFLLGAQDFRARAYAAKTIGQQAHRIGRAGLEPLAKAVRDDHPRVRLEAIVALSYFPYAKSIEIATKVLDRPRDSFIEYALTQTVHALKPHWLPALENGALAFDGDTDHMGFVFRADASPDVLDHVRRLAQSDSLTETDRVTMLTVLANIGEPPDLRLVLDRASQNAGLLLELAAVQDRRRIRPPGDLQPAVDRLSRSENTEVRAAAMRLAGHWRLPGLVPRVKVIASDSNESPTVRAEAVESFARLEGKRAAPVIDSWLTTTPDYGTRAAALRALARLDLDLAARRATGFLEHSTTEQDLENTLVPLLSRDRGPAALAATLAKSNLSPEAATTISTFLAARGRLDSPLRAALHKLGGIASDLLAYDGAYVRELAAEAEKEGNPAEGKKIYQSPALACVACHRIDGQGGVLGPDLSGIGRGLSREVIIESVLWPKRQIKEGFLSTTLTTKDGRVLNGYLQNEDREIITIRDVASGEEITLGRGEVKSRQDAGTIMPAGLTVTLSREDLRDLIAYLASLGK